MEIPKIFDTAMYTKKQGQQKKKERYFFKQLQLITFH